MEGIRNPNDLREIPQEVDPALLCDEEARLEELASYRVLDTPPERNFDDLTSLAALLCDAPVSLVSLIDRDREWFKSRAGLEAEEAPRDVAFGAHAIQAPNQVMVVEDATRDPRFQDNPLVTGTPGIRFYAGAPLISARGYALGTLCVIDQKPRKLSPQQLGGVQALARQVVGQLELRRTMEEMRGKQAQLVAYQRELEDTQKMLEEWNARLVDEMLTDALTGLRNRRAFRKHFAEEFDRALRYGNEFSLVLIDVDGFKAFNDTQGHPAGDEALIRIADLLEKHSRSSDIVARIGGDEFALILPCTPMSGARISAERLCRAVAGENWRGQPLTLSIGLATARPDHAGETAIEDSADAALYEAKRGGGNRVVEASG